MEHRRVELKSLLFGLLVQSVCVNGCIGSQSSCGNRTTTETPTEDTYSSSWPTSRVVILLGIFMIFFMSFCVCVMRAANRRRQAQSHQAARRNMMISVVSDILSQSIRDRQAMLESGQSNPSNSVPISPPKYEDVVKDSDDKEEPPSYYEALRESMAYSNQGYSNNS